MIGFRLETRLSDCSPAWQNFINGSMQSEWRDVSVRMINQQLKDFGGRYRFPDFDREHGFIEFADEQGFALFLLKWS